MYKPWPIPDNGGGVTCDLYVLFVTHFNYDNARLLTVLVGGVGGVQGTLFINCHNPLTRCTNT